ncbi:MAG: hypothetical protein HFE28_04800 [Clostridia bacterium]|nr:hypothetical protein [Clostridia bacterium]
MTATDRIDRAEKALAARFRAIDEIALFNQKKVLDAFREEHIAVRHFAQTTGYGYGDEGREKLGALFANIFQAERAFVSPLLASGTHALTVALFGILRPNDRVLCITGEPYDTLRGVIKGSGGSLEEFGISFDTVALKENGKIDCAAVASALDAREYKMVYIQRSRGYELRDAFTVEEIGAACDRVREHGFLGCIFVDNCYGEFVQKREPLEVGADVIVGSLIKNPGGGLAPAGGYVAGKERYLTLVEQRLTAPSVGGEIGSYACGYQAYYQGVFLAPHTTAQALKGGLLIGKCLEELGFENFPAIDKPLADITRAVRFETEEQLTAFICCVQACSPVDAYVRPEAWDMPGYDCKVIMAAGTFVGGATSELSADAPIRAPYTAYFQGGLTYEHCKIACKQILEKLTAL